MERHSPSNTTSLPTAPKGREADLGEERSGLGWTALDCAARKTVGTRRYDWSRGRASLPRRRGRGDRDPAERGRGGELCRSGAGSGGGGGGEGFRRGDERLGDGQGERPPGPSRIVPTKIGHVDNLAIDEPKYVS
jgi:hypothetical protein